MSDHASTAWEREPAQLVGAAYSVVSTLAAILAVAIADVPANATWLEFGAVFVAAGVPLLQGKMTREKVYSPETFRKLKAKKK